MLSFNTSFQVCCALKIDVGMYYLKRKADLEVCGSRRKRFALFFLVWADRKNITYTTLTVSCLH